MPEIHGMASISLPRSIMHCLFKSWEQSRVGISGRLDRFLKLVDRYVDVSARGRDRGEHALGKVWELVPQGGVPLKNRWYVVDDCVCVDAALFHDRLKDRARSRDIAFDEGAQGQPSHQIFDDRYLFDFVAEFGHALQISV